jgi:hypothetical protein
LANKQKAAASVNHDTWRIFIARTNPNSGHGDREVWMRCHLERSTVKRGSGANQNVVHAEKVCFTFHTGSGADAIKVKKEHVDTEALWDGLGDVGWHGRAYGLWTSYFGPPKWTNEYKDESFDPATKNAMPIKPRQVVNSLPTEGEKVRADCRDMIAAISNEMQERTAAISNEMQERTAAISDEFQERIAATSDELQERIAATSDIFDAVGN